MSRRIHVYKVSTAFALLLGMIVSPVENAQAGQKYTKVAELPCGGMTVGVVTNCDDDSDDAPYPSCTRQRFEFKDNLSGKVISKEASGKLLGSDATGRSLNALATGWSCQKGKTQSYVILRYYTGGNCEECEWMEILDLSGKKLASTEGRKTKRNVNAFDAAWDRLGIASTSPDDLKDIPLRSVSK